MAYSYETADEAWYKLLVEFAKDNRSNPTEAESLLWELLRKRQLGKPFRRQHIIGDFIVDFICLPAKLVVEVDGGYHNLGNQQTLDEKRTEWLEKKGYKVIRFTNEEVLSDTKNVIIKLKNELL